MPYKIYLSEDSTYIVLEETGELTGKEALERTLEAHKLGKKLGIKKYLVDAINARNTDSILNNYQFAYDDMHNTPGIDKTAIVATVISPDDHSHDFIETVAKNSGLNIKFFKDKEKAIEFLKSR